MIKIGSKTMMRISTVLILLVSLASCGKEIEDSAPQAEGRYRAPSDSNQVPLPSISLEEFIKKQTLKCDSDESCPSNIVKLIVVDKGRYNTCTGSLIPGNRILTSSSCLPRSLQIPGLKCINRIFAIFPGNQFQAEEIVNCKTIEYADVNYPKDPVLWKQDHAVFKLDKKVSRLPQQVRAMGVDQSRSILSWKVSQINQFDSLLKSDECRVVYDSYANPFSTNRFSPMLTATDCSFSVGSIGSPVIQDDRIVATYTSEMESSLYLFLKQSDLLVDEIGEFFHLSNLACSNHFTNRYMQPSQCEGERSTNRRDILRTKIMRSKSIHLDEMKAIEIEIETPNKFFVWDLKFYGDFRTATYEGHFTKPKCIFRTKDWIKKYRHRRLGRRTIDNKARIFIETPHYVFKTKLDTDLKAQSILSADAVKTYEIEFNPHSAYLKKTTDMKITSELHGEISSVVYEAVTADCSDI
jgi:hypothetical protein